MEFGSSYAPTFIANPIIVEVKDRPRLFFKEVPQIEKKEDSLGVFSRVPDGIGYVEDVRANIHYTLEDLDTEETKGMYQSMILRSSGIIKLEYQIIEDLVLTEILYISELNDKMIRYVLSRAHNEFILLDQPYMIIKEAI